MLNNFNTLFFILVPVDAFLYLKMYVFLFLLRPRPTLSQLWRWRERHPSVISVSGSLDLVDLHGVGRSDWYPQGPVKGRGSNSYHPIPLTRPKSQQRVQQKGNTISLRLHVRGSRFQPRPGQLPQHLPTTFLTVQPLQGWPRRSIASGHRKKNMEL